MRPLYCASLSMTCQHGTTWPFSAHDGTSLVDVVPSGSAVTSSTTQSGVPLARLAIGEFKQPAPIAEMMRSPRRLHGSRVVGVADRRRRCCASPTLTTR